MNPPPFSNGENPHTYPDCHVYEPEDYAADFEAAAPSSLRGPGGSGSRSVQPYELWCPFAVRKLAMPTQGEYALGYPQGAVIHATEGWSLNGDTDLENTIAYGITQKHAYFGISRTGTIYQTHPLSEWGHHAGATRHAVLGSGLSAKLVGIELASAGLVQPEGAGFRALGWPERFTAEQVRHAKAEGNVTRAGHYLAYTPEQEASLTKLLLWLHQNNPDVFKLEYVLGHDEIAVDRQGRLGRKQDPGGGLSMTMEDYRCHLAGGTPTRGGLAPSPDPAPRELCWETAFLLASASKLAYRPEEVIRETLSKSSWGFLKVDFLSEADTQVIVASDASRVVVAYRGSKELGDWLGNLEFLQQEQLTLGRVHRGFSQAFAVVREALFTTLTDHDPESRKELWLTGHSLGGALALLTAAELPNPGRITGIYTFGQPRAGLTDFQTKVDEVFVGRYFRFVNFDDVVPRIPPGDYVHAGHLIWFNAKGEPDTAPPEQTRGPIPAAAQYSEAEFLHFKAFLESARQHATRSDPAEPEEEGLELFRGEMPGGFNNHRIDRYIAFVHRQKPALAALEVRGRPASAPTVPPPAAAVTVEAPPPAPSPAPVSPPANLNAFLKPQPLLPLAVHVTWSPTSHQLDLCQETAKAIFEFLNHPVARPASADDDELNPDLESGAGIPVFVGHHCERIRESVEKRLVTGPPQNKATIVFLLLDEQTAHERQQGTPFGSLLNYLFDPNRITSFGTNVLVVPVCLHASAKGSLPEGLSPLTAAETPDQPAEAIARQAALTTANFLMRRRPGAGSEAPAPVKLLLSYSHSDIDITGTLATQLSEWLSHSFGQFFTSENLPTPDSHRIPKGRIEGDTVILIIRSDSYTSSPGTLRDVLDAKKSGMPIVTLNVLREGRGRSFSCEGNSITLAWNPTTPRGETPKPVEFSDLVSRCIKVCLRAWLHHLHFHLLPEAVFELRGLDWKKDLITPISRPPELLDLVQGPLSDVGSGVIFYPDPPLSSSESRILRRAQPKVRLATPTSLSNEVWRRIPCPPLSGMQIALSLSISPDLAPDFPHISPEFKGSFSNGVLVPHMDAAVAYLSLSLIRSGATLGFGGTVRERSYASFLSGLVDVYNQTAPTGKSLLRCFRRASSAAPESNEEDSNTHTVNCEAVPTQPPAVASVQGALDLTQMRRRMAQDCHVRILMGGRTKPKLTAQDDGYHGRFPGQAEEAFQFLSAGKPIYVSGGFWGVSGQVAKALCNELADLPRETEWLQESRYAELCQGYDAARPSDWNLPATLDDLWKAFAEFGKGFFWGPGSEDPQKPWTNGLTVAENRALFSAVQPDHISALVTKGLEKVASQSQGKDNRPPLNIALFNGSFIDVPDTE
ncbi:MAG: N-acetyl-anhydromuramyl-L-alanine amidase AmpD, partial [Verrucomicrobia bacterium]